MKYIYILSLFFFINNCSLNKDSNYWTNESVKTKNNQKELSTILKKSEDITTMTVEEYEIFIDAYTKKSKYPNISE